MTKLVIGASGTIGRACVDHLLSQGDQVVAADLVTPDIEGAVNRQIDVSDLESVRDLVSDLESSHPITGLIYAAGVNFTGHVDKTDWQQYQKLMQVNLQGAFHVASQLQAAARVRPREFACVFISSTAGLKGEAGGSVYVATKFGLIGFTQSFAAEIASIGGRANVVCPGNVDSPMLRRLAAEVAGREGKSQEQVLQEFASSSSLNRLIDPAEVASSCGWLLSKASSAISGQTLVVDGLS